MSYEKDSEEYSLRDSQAPNRKSMGMNVSKNRWKTVVSEKLFNS
jgi:hypothetical protein